MEKDWVSWKNEDWVSRLGDAIFPVRGSEPETFSNISSSPRLLLEISGDNTSVSDTNQLAAMARAVVRIHGDSVARAFDYSRWTLADKIRPTSIYPQYLTLLFLTIKAASAAENNHGEGQFQERLKIILSEAGIESAGVNYSSLPKFWQALHMWNKNAIHPENLRLKLIELPRDVGNETRIGYSKRVAFPSYRDQEKLNKLFLMTDQIKPNSSPAKICSELRGVKGFSESFQAQVEDLYLKILKGEYVAHHPVLTTIEDISWETELIRKRELGEFEVRVSEIKLDQSHGFRVLGDKVARETLVKFNSEVATQPPGEQGGLGNLMTDLSLSELFRLARRVDHGKASSGKILHLKPFSMLVNNFLLLRKSPSFEYVSSYKVRDFDDYIVYFGAEHEQEIIRRAQSLDLEQDPEVIRFSKDYRFLRLCTISRESLYDLLLCLSPSGKGLENLAARDPATSERLFSKINKVYLWSAVTPVKFLFPQGSVPRFELTGDEGIVTGYLKPSDAHWIIDPRCVKGVTCPRELLVQSELAGKDGVKKIYPLVHSLPDPLIIDTQKFADYYYTNTKGGLSPAAHIFSLDSVVGITRVGSASGFPSFISTLSGQDLSASQDFASVEPRITELVWSTIEHLQLRFNSAKGLSWGNYKAYLLALSNACGSDFHSLDRLFKNSALILTGYNYQSCGSAIIPFPRLVSETLKDGKRYARLTGLIAPVEVRILEEHGFKCVQTGIGDGATVFKPFVFEVGHLCKIEDLTELLGACSINDGTISRLLEQEKNSQDTHAKTHPIDKEIESGTEVYLNGVWEKAFEGSCFGSRGVYRKQTFSSTRYYVLKDGDLFETRSNEWAFLLFCSKEGSLCEHDHNGNIRFARNVSSLPPLFTAWWMHFGGGGVSYTPDGSLLLQVEENYGKKACFEEFLSIGDFDVQDRLNRRPYIVRRKLALRKNQLNKNCYYDAY